MFKLLVLEDTIRIPPKKFGEPLSEAGHEQLRMKYEGMVDDELGYVIAVADIKVNPTGKIIPGDGATYHRVSFSLLTYFPKIQEVVEGEREGLQVPGEDRRCRGDSRCKEGHQEARAILGATV